MSRGQSDDLLADICALGTLDDAWERVRANNGCSGGDGESVDEFQRRAASRLVALSNALKNGSYRPRDLRFVQIPKRSGGTRPLAIPSIIDRVAQTACTIVLTPILDPKLADSSFAYRPGRSVTQAVHRIGALRKRGYGHVVEADIQRCFERIPHDAVLTRLEQALQGQNGEPVVELVAHWLEHGGQAAGTPTLGLAQGSPLSPLLCNLHLDRLDRQLVGKGVAMVRYADNFVLLCKTRDLATSALAAAEAVLGGLGLHLRPDKTRLGDFDRGFEFLGHLFVRSITLKQVADPEDDADTVMRALGDRDRQGAEAENQELAVRDVELSAGYDRGQRVLHIIGQGRKLGLRNQSYVVTNDEGRELIGISQTRVDRIELGPDAETDSTVLRHALNTGTDLAFVDGWGETEGWLAPPDFAHAALHLAQARLAIDPVLAATLARQIVDGRLRSQRAKLHLLNREARDADVILATKTLGGMIRKLAGASVGSLRGHEGAAAAVYWPALGRLCDLAPQPFRRTRPATDPLNAAINYLTAILERDMRAAILKRGLHPGFGVLHVATDGHAACVWDMMEAFRAPMSEGLAVTLFNQNRLRPEMFTPVGASIRIDTEARRALVLGYEAAAGRVILNPATGRRLTWRKLMEAEAGALAAHCRAPETVPFVPFVQGY